MTVREFRKHPITSALVGVSIGYAVALALMPTNEQMAYMATMIVSTWMVAMVLEGER